MNTENVSSAARAEPVVMPFPSRTPVMCTDCGTIHSWPVPKFSIGQRVTIVGDGNQHQDKLGTVVVITGLQSMMTMPCDEVEYLTSAGFGSIRESRLESRATVDADELTLRSFR